MADVTGGTPPTNASPFAVPADIKTVYDHFGGPSMYVVSTVAGLPSSGNWEGRILSVSEDDSVRRWNGASWDIIWGGAYISRGRATAQSIPDSTWTTVTWSASEEAGGIDYASGIFTVPIAGRYLVSASVSYASGGTAGQRTCRVRTSAGLVKQSQQMIPNATYGAIASVTTVATLPAGGTIYIEAYQSQGSAVNIGVGSDQTFITIDRI